MRGIGEEMMRAWRRRDKREAAGELGLIGAQFRWRHRNVGDGRAFVARELADAVDGVVIIEGQQVVVAGTEGIRLADQLERAGRVRREDDHVLVGGGVEVAQDVLARLLDTLGHRHRGQVLRVRVAKDAAGEHGDVLAHLRLGVDAPAGIIQVDLPLLIEPRVLGRAQRVQLVGRSERRECAEEGFIRGSQVFGGGWRIEARAIRRWHVVCSFVEQSGAVARCRKSTTHLLAGYAALSSRRGNNACGLQRSKSRTWISCRCSTSYRPSHARG